ncbi:hypothetical protein G9A89_018610 [Geosiphon pyriformis]|nr:hypothetical protein G9A89_018610 [Geosiphon pyriformis]
MSVKAKKNYKHQQNAINIALAGMSTSNITSTFGQFPFQKPTKSEKKQEKEEEEESEDQEFIYQNPITENPDIGIPNFKTQQD